ncbi:carbohydrate-binding protein [Saccharicrinis sp. FJH2]|uniref:InlB B-repeat-containing protein n=1 Tax=Saccharicrinis sp. FJH65 TaxID=3344659 RepID=UPI0035F433F0
MRKQFLLSLSFLFAGLLSINATTSQVVQAEDFTVKSDGDNPRALTGKVGYIYDGLYIGFTGESQIEFDGNETAIEVNIVSYNAGGELLFILDDPDPTVGTVIATATIDSDIKLYTSSTFSESYTGKHDFYLYFKNTNAGTDWLYDVDYFKFTGDVPNYTVTTGVSPENSGLVIKDFTGSSVSQGSQVLFYAQRLAGYTFNHWEDGSGNSLSTENPFTYTITGDLDIKAVFETMTETYALPSWTFDNEYVANSSGDVETFIPVMLPISWRPGFKDAMVYPDNYPATGSSNLTSKGDTIFTSLTGENQVCRINWTDANTVSDFTDPAQHNQYFEFQFPTTGFKDISLEFSFSGGQSDVSDYLELVYSVDNGTTWVDGGAFYSEAHWNTWVYADPVLTDADNKAMVKVRLIGITLNTGDNLNFNLDYFTVHGTVTAISKTQVSSSVITTGAGYIKVAVDSPSDVNIYSIEGKLMTRQFVESVATIPSQSGIYIVKVGGQVKKVQVAK